MNTPNLIRRVFGHFLVAASLTLAAIAQAQNENVTWQNPANISGPFDVSTQGTFYGSWAPYDGNANTLPVNGVIFQGNPTPPGFAANFPSGDQSGYNAYSSPGTTNANYNTLLETAAYASSGDGTIAITWSDTPGHTYLIQVWANDGRGNGRSEIITGGANASGSLVFGNAPGQYVIGTYLADSSGSETITLSGVGSANGDVPQINLLQLRDITVTPVTNYQSAVLADNPLAFYALNPAADPAGTSPDLTGNGNNGTPSNITPAIGPTPFITNAANFDITNESFDDLSFANNPGLLNFSGPITLEAWVQPSSAAEFADVVAKGYDFSSDQEIVLRTQGSSFGTDYFGSSGSVGVTGGVETTNWTYMVLSSDGINCSLYMNGALVAQSPDPNGAVNFSDDWVIGDGSSSGNTRYFNGNISEVAIYNYGLSPSQVLTHYLTGEEGGNASNAIPFIFSQPAPQATYAGGSVQFSVTALSLSGTTNQWYQNNSPLAGQTNATLSLINVQSGNVGTYFVKVGNINGTTNSASVALSLLTPGDSLTWSPSGTNNVWDTDISANWINQANDLPSVFNADDAVLFNDTPGVPTNVTVSNTVSPSLITVDSTNNDFNINGPGAISGAGSLVKKGPSTLTITSGGNFSGSATIAGGVVYAGDNSFQSVSEIVVTNNSTLDLGGGTLGGNKPVTVSGVGFNGEGAIYNSFGDDPQQTIDVTLAGDTTFGAAQRWDLASGSQITGPHNLTVDWSGGAGYGQWNTVAIGATVPEIFVTNGIVSTNTTTLGITFMDTSCQNPSTIFAISSNCQLTFYDGGFNGSLLNGGVVNILSPNIAFSGTSIHILSGGMINVEAQGVNFNGSSLIFENNSSLQTYFNAGTNDFNNAVTFNGVAHLVIGDHSVVYTNLLSGSGGFVLDFYNQAMILSASNTYSGPTVIGSNGNTPEVALTGNGSISHSPLIFFGGNSATVPHIDVSGRSDNTLTLASGQTLAGIGGINGDLVVSASAILSPAGTNTTIGITTGSNPVGELAASDNVTLDGTTVIKLDGSGTNDAVAAGAAITYGGTLNLVNISAKPLAAGDSFQVFNAATYSGSFANITPATPGPGLTWDTSKLNSSGTIAVLGPGGSGPVIIGPTVSGGNLVFSGMGGTANGTYYVLTSSNLLSGVWTRAATNSFDASGNFSVTNAISSNNPQLFYRVEVAQ